MKIELTEERLSDLKQLQRNVTDTDYIGRDRVNINALLF
jgi:hypothetical protein